MRRAVSALVLLATGAVALVLLAQTPGRDVAALTPGPTLRSGTSSIHGRVISADAGTPIRNALVQLTASVKQLPGAAPVPAMLTDGDGQFVARGLPAGAYRVLVTKAGFVSTSFGAGRFGAPGTPVPVADGATADGIQVPLTKAAALSGRVIDTFGEPVSGATVAAEMAVSGETSVDRSAQTDDLGEYRIGGLTEGNFLVRAIVNPPVLFSDGTPFSGNAVSLVNDRLAQMSAADQGRTLTYYPGVPTSADAQPIAMGVDDERTTIDVVVPPVLPTTVGPRNLAASAGRASLARPGANSSFRDCPRGAIESPPRKPAP